MKFNVIFIFLVFVSIKLSGQTPFTCKGQYFLTFSKDINSESGLFEVVLSPGGEFIVFNPVAEKIGVNMNAIGFRSTDNFIYGIDPDEYFLYRLGSDGLVINLGIPYGIPTSNNYYAGDVTPDGKYLLLMGDAKDESSNLLVLIDLEDPDFNVDVIIYDGPAKIFDIAFDPFTNDLYGFSGLRRKLVQIDIETGKVISEYPVLKNISSIGALFFDSNGNLFGYGSIKAGETGSHLIRFDKNNGTGFSVADGPRASGNDGCSCPYNITLLKTVSTPTALPCTSVEYDFIILNNSSISGESIQFLDEMPSSFSINGIVRNPFGGDVEIKGNVIKISNMVIPKGVDTLSISVEIGGNSKGIYNNQAILSNLPTFLGEFILSDNPNTDLLLDSTTIEILPFDIDTLETEYNICNQDSVSIDISAYGLNYQWDNSSTDPIQTFYSGGDHSVTISSSCDEKVLNIFIDTMGVLVDIQESNIQLRLGDQIQLKATVSSDIGGIDIRWTNDERKSLSCIDCLDPLAQPYFDTEYKIKVIDEFGCKSEDKVYVRLIKDREIFAPTMFTPNYDGLNDWFTIFTKNMNSDIELSIFDRWGNKVFYRPNLDDNIPSSGWDGTYNGKLVQSGIYTWIASITFKDGVVAVESGGVTVVY